MSDDLFERREAERRYALNFLDYEVLSATGEVLGRSLARTLNLSETGLRLETGQFFEPGATATNYARSRPRSHSGQWPGGQFSTGNRRSLHQRRHVY